MAQTQQEIYRRWYAKNAKARYARAAKRLAEKRLVLASIKLGRGCTDCGYNAYACALEFDHIKGNKRFNVGQSMCYSMSNLLSEIDKCEVVCANCHKVRTMHRRERAA